MGTKAQNLAVYKSRLRDVITNIKKLENARSAAAGILCDKDINQLMEETSKTLNQLETASTSKIFQIIKKRKRKRKKIKNKKVLLGRAKNKLANKPKTSNKNSCKTDIIQINRDSTNERKNTAIVSKKPHQRLRNYNDSNRFLQIFELLELLQRKRSQEKSTEELSSKLSKLRSIWNVIRLENMPQQTFDEDIQNQWSTVLFGVREQSYYKQKRSYKDLISIRRKWDSYITQDPKVGSSVPSGWVLPRENPDPRWLNYAIQ